jgi:hypothetical protein
MILYGRTKPELSWRRAPEINRSIAVQDDFDIKASPG